MTLDPFPSFIDESRRDLSDLGPLTDYSDYLHFCDLLGLLPYVEKT